MSEEHNDLKKITRRVDKTKRMQWRDQHRDGMHDCHPIIRQLAFLLYSQDKSIVAVFRAAKVAPCLLSQWVTGLRNPQIHRITAVLDQLGMKLVIVHKTEEEKAAWRRAQKGEE